MNIVVRYGFSEADLFRAAFHGAKFVAAIPADFYGCLDATEHIPVGGMYSTKHGGMPMQEMRPGWHGLKALEDFVVQTPGD